MKTTLFSYRHLPYFAFLILLIACQPKEQAPVVIPEPIAPVIIPSAMDAIKQRGDTLVAVTASNSTSYFIYKGRIMGYEYEMLNKFTESLGLHLRIKLEENPDTMLAMLARGEADIAAYSMTVTNERRHVAQFTDRLFHSPQCLIQKKPSNWRSLLPHQINNRLTRNVLNIGKDLVYVADSSSHLKTLEHLGEEIGDSINIVPVKDVTTPYELIDFVAKGQIKYSIADREIASLYAAHNEDIDYETPVSMPHKKAWGVRKNSPELLGQINQWLTKFKRYKEYYFIYDKYFNNPASYRKIGLLSPTKTGILSVHDDLIKAGATELSWDWRLLASQIYQESNFDQSQESWMGAIGLMQIIPATGKMHGYTNLHHTPTNIKAGISHIQYIEKHFTELDPVNKIKFTLASYNVGLGHIFDAQRLATSLGKNPNLWDGNVAEAIRLKSQAKYYKLPICRNGYCRGSEPFNYVNEIMKRYESYKMLID